MQLPFVLGLLCVGFAFAVLPEDYLYEDKPELQIFEGLVNDTINEIIAGLAEPITVDSLALNFSSIDAISGEASISDLKLSGLKNLVATEISIALIGLSLNATIVVPEITLDTKYVADVVVAELVPLYGSGRAGIILDNIQIALGGKVAITNGISIANVTIQVTLDDASFDLHGLLNNEDFSSLINQVLNDNVANFLNEYTEVIGDIISPIVQEIIDSLLG